jgi:predicted nucleotidyltransferase
LLSIVAGSTHSSHGTVPATPKVFGSVARGDASQISDLDLLVVLDPSGGNPLLRVAGLAEELSELLQMRVDVVADELLRAPVSASAHADAVPL